MERIDGNTVLITGYVNFIKTNFINDSSITKVLLGKKTGENTYMSLNVNFYKETSDKVAQQIKKGDVIAVEGYLVQKKFKTRDGVDVESIEINARDFCKVKYDENKKRYVEDTDVPPTIEEAFPEEEVPWN